MATGDGTYITVAEVRSTCGIQSTEISDADVGVFIADAEKGAARMYNTAFTPKQRIEIRDGNGTNTMILMKNPVLAVRDLYIDGTQEDTTNLNVYRESGKIELSSSATASRFTAGSQKIRIKYLYGFLVESDTSDTSTAATTAGTSVDIPISGDSDDFEDGWVEIYGMDGYKEAAQVTSVSQNTVTVDQLLYPHESGSTIVLLEPLNDIKKLMKIAASIGMVARIVGESYDDTTGYTLAEMSVQKGEPYTQWRETATQLIKERDIILNTIKPRLYIA